MMKGRVICNISDSFVVRVGDDDIVCKSRGKLKRFDKVVVGDIVDIENDIIVSVEPRKNILVRPSIANIDQLFIVISQLPKPDFYLVDKLLIKCQFSNIKPILIISKSDIVSDGFAQNIISEYSTVVDDILLTSTVDGSGIKELINLMRGKLSAFAGQSAVGKSCLLNILGGNAKVGELSARSGRGKHTTRHIEIYCIDDMWIADTPGFSRLDINEIKYTDLHTFYPEFEPYKNRCRYPACCHVSEKISDCAVKSALNDCKLNKNRYNRYIYLYKELKMYWEKKYE